MNSESKQNTLSGRGGGSGGLEFESKEAASDLLPLLAESGQIVPCIKVIFDRKMDRKIYNDILNSEATKKESEIQRICNDNYTDFIDAIDQLLGVQLSVTQLKSEITELNQNINNKGKQLTDKIDKLIILKQTRRNMDIAINRLNRMKYILSLMKKITELINNKKYIAALKNLNQLTTQIIQLKGSAITQEIFSALPKYTEKIKKAVKVNFSEWLHNINKESSHLGKVAILQTKQYLNTIDNENEDAMNPMQAIQDQMNMALQRQFGSQGTLRMTKSMHDLVDTIDNRGMTSSNNNINNEDLNGNNNNNSGTNVDGNQSLFERIENLDFNPVYQCIHVHETLQSLDEFKNAYMAQRAMMKDDILKKMAVVNLAAYSSLFNMAASIPSVNSGINTSTGSGIGIGGGGFSSSAEHINASLEEHLDPSKVSDESSHLNRDFFSSLCGFFVMEHAVCSRYQQLMDTDELQQEWASAVTVLTKRLKYEVVDQAKTPYELIEVKYELYVLGKSIENYDFKITQITAFLEDLRIKFETTLNNRLLKNTKLILANDAFIPLEVKTIQEWNNIEEFGLNINVAKEKDEKSKMKQSKNNNNHTKTKSNIEEFRDAMKDSKNKENNRLGDSVELPKTMPFSISVIIICQALCDLIEQYQMYAKYLSDMSSHIRNAVQKGIVKIVCGEIQNVIMGTTNAMGMLGGMNSRMDDEKSNNTSQARKGTERRRIGISELAQLAVNTAYLENACGFFEKELNEENANQEFLDEQEIVIPKLHEARESLGNLQQTCYSSLMEHLGNKMDHLMKGYMSKISWMPDKVNAGPHEWVKSITKYLNETLSDKVKYFPLENRESVFFIACTRINQYLVRILTSTGDNNDDMGMMGMMGGMIGNNNNNNNSNNNNNNGSGDHSDGSGMMDGSSSENDFTHVKKFNVIGIYNLSLDVMYLENEANRTNIQGLTQSYLTIRQIVNLLISGRDMMNYLDENYRIQHYAHVSPANFRNLLEKYNTLGIFTKKNLTKDLAKIATDKATIKTLLKSLKDVE